MSEFIQTSEREPVSTVESIAFDALNNYAQNSAEVERSDLLEHSYRVSNKLRAFAGNLVPNEMVAVSFLHDVVSRFKEGEVDQSEKSELARAVLADFFTSPHLNEEQVEYISANLNDTLKIDEASGRHRRDMADLVLRDGEISTRVAEMISENYCGEIPKHVWKTTEPFLDFEHMDVFSKQVNLEAIILKSCELMDNMRHPSIKRQSRLLQDVLEAESFYAPMVEVLGLEGLASALRSDAHLIRFAGRDQMEAVERAREIREKILDVGVTNIIHQVFDVDDQEVAIYPVVGEDEETDRPFVDIGEFAARTTNETVVAGNFRLKTLGSLANKVDQCSGELPMDAVGLMVISNDLKESASEFACFVRDRLPNFNAHPARRKNKAVYVQGAEEYVNSVRLALAEAGVEEGLCEFKVQTKEDELREGIRHYEVSKVTFFLDDEREIPVEVQFLTKEERRRSRLGEVAHIIYKYLSQFSRFSEEYRDTLNGEERAEVEQEIRDITSSAVNVLSNLYDRMRYVSPAKLEVNERSIAGGEDLVRSVIR